MAAPAARGAWRRGSAWAKPPARRCASGAGSSGRCSTPSTPRRASPDVTELSPDWTPRLGRGARLHSDAVRGVDLLLVPERAVTLNPTASAVLGMCDGTRTV